MPSKKYVKVGEIGELQPLQIKVKDILIEADLK